MKKLLGILVLGLLLGGCIQGPAGPLGAFNDKETKINQKKYPYMSWWYLSKKGMNKSGVGYGFTRAAAKENAMKLCNIELSKLRKKGISGKCGAPSSCTSKGYTCEGELLRDRKSVV